MLAWLSPLAALGLKLTDREFCGPRQPANHATYKSWTKEQKGSSLETFLKEFSKQQNVANQFFRSTIFQQTTEIQMLKVNVSKNGTSVSLEGTLSDTM